MKKLKNIFWGFIILGLVLGIVSVALYRFDFKQIYADMTNSKDYVFVEESFDQLKNDIKLDFSNADMIVSKSQNDDYKISYYTKDDNKAETNFDDGKIHIKYREKFTFKSIRPFNVTDPKHHKVLLQVPASFDGDIIVDNDNRKIDIKDLDGVNILDIKNDNGAIVLSKISAYTINVENDNGSINLAECNVNKSISIENKNGKISVKESTIADKLTISNKNGSINLDDIDAKNVSIKNGNGGINLSDCSGTKVDVENNNGTINLKSVAFDGVVVKNSNGSNTVSIKGNRNDYAVELDTRNGKGELDGQRFDGSDGSKDREKWVRLENKNGKNILKFI